MLLLLLLQFYQDLRREPIKELMPLLQTSLLIEAPPGASTAKPKEFVAFLSAQVKTLFFLTYVIKWGGDRSLRGSETKVVNAVVRLLRQCPPQAIECREHILMATRLLLSTEVQRVFHREIESLLDERVLFGIPDTSQPGVSVLMNPPVGPNDPEPRDTTHSNRLGPSARAHTVAALRPLAFSTVADLVHHVRDRLHLSHLPKIVHLFSRNVHDPTLPLSVQITCLRLLLNLVDIIYNNKLSDPAPGRRLLTRILNTLVTKFRTISRLAPMLLAAERSAYLRRRRRAQAERRGREALHKVARRQALPPDVTKAFQASTDPGVSTPDDDRPSAAEAAGETLSPERLSQVLRDLVGANDDGTGEESSDSDGYADHVYAVEAMKDIKTMVRT
ncbi:Nipped-A, partial [Symbiodinium sp. KB8]